MNVMHDTSWPARYKFCRLYFLTLLRCLYIFFLSCHLVEVVAIVSKQIPCPLLFRVFDWCHQSKEESSKTFPFTILSFRKRNAHVYIGKRTISITVRRYPLNMHWNLSWLGKWKKYNKYLTRGMIEMLLFFISTIFHFNWSCSFAIEKKQFKIILMSCFNFHKIMQSKSHFILFLRNCICMYIYE